MQIEYVRGRLPAPPIVLLPGLFAGSWVWKPVWDHLTATGHSVLQLVEPFAALDIKAASIAVLRQQLVGVLDQYEISRAVVCGNSLGALVALDMARHHPGRVPATVISGCPGLGRTVSLGLRQRGDMSRQNAERIAGQIFFDRSAIPNEMIERSYAIARDRRCAINMLRYALAIRKFDLRTCLPQVRCDVLMVWGEQDRIAPVEDWEQNLHLIARASMWKLACCGHAPMVEKPAEFNAILTKFLQERD